MITIDCTLKTREDLRQLTPLELKIADCLMECYYENEDINLIDSNLRKEDSLPILLFFNIIRNLSDCLENDPYPRQIVTTLYKQLTPHYNSYIGMSNYSEILESDIKLFPAFLYITNDECERVLIWGGLASKIMYHPRLDASRKTALLKSIQKCVKDSSHRERCFEPFLRIQPEEMPPAIPSEPTVSHAPSADEPATNASQQNEPVDAAPMANEQTTEASPEENNLLDYVKLDDLLEQAAQHYFNCDAFIQSLNTLLTLMVNKQSGGDPNINNLLKAKLKLFSQKVKQLQEVEKKRHATPKFHHLILHPEPKKLLRRLHQLIDGKSGAAVGAVLLHAQLKGYLSKVPTRAQFESEFTLNGGWNAIQNYMNDNNEKAWFKANKIIIFKGE